MRRLNLFLVFGALILTILTVVFEWPLFQEVAYFLADNSGRYKVVHLWGLLFLIHLSPAILLLLILLFFGNRKKRTDTNLLDDVISTGITVKRDRNLYGALFPVDIYVDDVKKATVIAGKTARIPLNPGAYRIKVIAMKHFSPELNIEVGDQPKELFCGFELDGTMQNVFIREM